jgi:hypothetical protein
MVPENRSRHLRFGETTKILPAWCGRSVKQWWSMR